MKSIEPKADLPPASSQTMLTYSALPVQRPYHQARDSSKNMTGVFLSQNAYGLPSNKQQQQKIPPLAKPRGAVHQPPMMLGYHRQHRRPQDPVIRKRGDGKAFQPMPIKRAKPKLVRHEYHAPSAHVIGPKADYHSVTRKSARQRVPASNDGVTHLEDLCSLSSGGRSDGQASGGQELETLESMLDSIDLAAGESERGLAGLVECYKKICKGNASSVHNLVSLRTSPNFKHKKRKMPPNDKTGPLVIRSFRNPQHPHSVVQYSSPQERAGTPHGTARPPVPAPYFYSSRGLPQTSEEGGARVRLTRMPGAAVSRNPDVILAAPGAGSISKSAGSRRGGPVVAHGLPEGIAGTTPPMLPSNTKIIDSDEAFSLRENFNVPASTPVASVADIFKMSESDGGDQYSDSPRQRGHNVISLPRNGALSSAVSSTAGGSSGAPHIQNVPTGAGSDSGSIITGNGRDLEVTSVTTDAVEAESGTEPGRQLPTSVTCLAITLSVENEDGTFDTKNFEAEEEKVAAGNGSTEEDVDAQLIAEKAKESQARKQAELDQLLEEHHQLVSCIEELEKRTGDTEADVQSADTDGQSARGEEAQEGDA